MTNGGKAVVLRGVVGFSISFFTPISAVFGEAARFHYWPEPAQIAAAFFVGLVGGLTAVAMFMDGSFSRWQASNQTQQTTGAMPRTG